MESALGYAVDMTKLPRNTIDSTDFPKPRKAARKRQPVIVILIITLFASSTVMCAVLIIPILWVAVTDASQPPRPTYQQCDALKGDTERLACYDKASHQIVSPRSAKDIRRMTFGELLGAQRNDQARNKSSPPE
jgi:hypothetical protein